MSLFDSVSSRLFSSGRGFIGKYIPPKLNGAIEQVINGDFQKAGLTLFEKYLPFSLGVQAQYDFWGSPTELFGGITLEEAKSIYNESQKVKYAKKNLFLIEVSSSLMGDVSQRINIFVTALSYAPFTISGEKKKIGAAHVDIVNSADPVELSITTYDDKNGFVKNWFARHCAATASQDGTVGVPNDYAIKIKIVHGYITQNSNQKGYEDVGLFRPANIDISLSRGEDSLEELTISLVQLDTFMSA